MPDFDLMDKKAKHDGPEDEFKLFHQIESAIEGILEFIMCFIRTTVFLIFHPMRLKRLVVVGEKKLSFSRPVTYLTMTTVIFAPLSRFTYKYVSAAIYSLIKFLTFSSEMYYNIGYTLAYETSPLSMLNELPSFSADAILKVTLPTVLVITASAAVMGTITQYFRIVQRQSFIHAICYVAGFQFITFSMCIFANMGLYVLNTYHIQSLMSFTLGYFYIILMLLFVVFLILWPPIMLFSVLMNTTIQPFFVRYIKRILSFTSAIIISLIVLSFATVSSIIPLVFEKPRSPEHIWSVKSIELDGKVLNARLILTNHRSKPYMLLEQGMKLSIGGVGYIKTIPVTLSSWSDSGRHVLEIKKDESKWVIVQAIVDDNIRRILNDAGENKYFIDFFFAGFENGDNIQIRGYWKPGTNN
jgi:hypothetical protein